MRVLFVGDYKLNTGPSNVNKDLLWHMPKTTLRIKNKFIVSKLFEIIYKVFISDVVIISGITYSGYIALVLASFFNKKTIYLMHGSVKYETSINNINNSRGIRLEKYYLKKVNKILCVSEKYLEWFNEYYKGYDFKSDFLNNGIDWKVLEQTTKEIIYKDNKMIITMGGGRPQKNNLILANSIENLNNKYNEDYVLYVLGRDYMETEGIKKISCVKYIGQVKRFEAIKLLCRAKLFIQNSSLESFGLAPIEALMCGCDVLISQYVGSTSIIKTIQSNDIIYDYKDINEITEKIRYVLKNGNNVRLLNGINREDTSCEYAANRLVSISEDLFYRGI